MKKQLTILLVSMFFLALMATVVMAENESSIEKSNSNHTAFAECVVNAAQIRQVCYVESRNISKQCVNEATLGEDRVQIRQCRPDYKASKRDCKSSFKEVKRTCIQEYKPRLWERMKYFFE